MSCLSAFSNPAFGLTQLNGQDWILGPQPLVPSPPPAEPSRWLVLSHPADLPLSAAPDTDIVEVLLEMGASKRLQESAPEREKLREDSKPKGVRRWREEGQMFVG